MSPECIKHRHKTSGIELSSAEIKAKSSPSPQHRFCQSPSMIFSKYEASNAVRSVPSDRLALDVRSEILPVLPESTRRSLRATPNYAPPSEGLMRGEPLTTNSPEMEYMVPRSVVVCRHSSRLVDGEPSQPLVLEVVL